MLYKDTRHWQPYVKNLYQHTLVDLLHLKLNLKLSLVFDLVSRFLLKLKCDCVSNLGQRLLSGLVSHVRQPSSQHHCRRQLLLVNRPPYIVFNIKRYLALILLLILPYTTTTQALSAVTVQVINGNEPYLTLDNGITKITTSDGLLGITLSDGTRITPANNTSSKAKPIILPELNQSFADIDMLVPTDADSIDLSAFIGEPYHYWGDDDGDGQGANGVTITGSLSVNITNKYELFQSNRNEILNICDAPYTLELTSTDVSLTTQYGVPNNRSFVGSSATYYINSKGTPTICAIKPSSDLMSYPENLYGPTNIWDPYKGFFVQSTEPASYSRNFPTTGADELSFYIDLGGIDVTSLTWPPVSHGGITANMITDPNFPYYVEVTLNGPTATTAQQNSASPGSVATPSLPQTFEIVGYDSNNTAVLKYGFVLKQWFILRGFSKGVSFANQNSWCSAMIGYRMPKIKDLTNATGGSWTGGVPSSVTGNYSNRNIGAGLIPEWGNDLNNNSSGSIWAIGNDNSQSFIVKITDGSVLARGDGPRNFYIGVCAYP